MTNLPAFTWDQAAILGLATANGFQAVGIKPATIRKWASRRHIAAAGKAPGGAHLYPIAAVTRHAVRAPSTTVARVSHLEADGRPMPTGGSSFVSPDCLNHPIGSQ
jgi:hypothetical protein